MERRAKRGQRTVLIGAAVVALLATTCTSGESDRGADGSQLDRPSGDVSSGAGTDELAGTETDDEAVAEPAPIERGEPAENRLAVLDRGGTLLTMDPDGSASTVIARSDGLEISQPGFSPDGTRLVWSELRPVPGLEAFETFLVTANGDGSNPVETETPFLSFYSFWDPTSSRVAFIGNVSGSRVGLGLAEAALGAPAALPVNAGRPYFFSWRPDGKGLLARVSNELILVGDDGQVSPIGPVTAEFRVPIWSADNQLYFAESSGSTQELVRLDLAAEARTPLVSYSGQLFAVLDPTGRRLAVQVIDDPGADERTPPEADAGAVEVTAGEATGELVNAGLDGEPGDPPVLPVGLSIVDVVTGEVEVVSGEPVVSFFWSPDGRRLLIGAIEVNRAGPDARLDEIVYAGSTLRWDVWEDGQTTAHGRFVPSFVSIQFLLFFEQYAQSHSFWSTDSSSFVYAGEAESGESGVWVQNLTAPDGPDLVADGVLAVWSPT